MLRAGSSDPLLTHLLAQHPGVAERVETDEPGIVFGYSRDRRVLAPTRVHDTNTQTEPWFGLIETADNNPLVCADVAQAPSPAETLALIALIPVLATGLVLEPPTFVADVPLDEMMLVRAIQSQVPVEQLTLMELERAHPTVRRAKATVLVQDPGVHGLGGVELFDRAYEEPYDRVLYVRRDEESVWNADLVANRPYAVYRLGITEGEGSCLLSVSVMADLNGKLGACQMVHLMNVMDGQEESLGIPELLPLP